jgi:hypothetical protein
MKLYLKKELNFNEIIDSQKSQELHDTNQLTGDKWIQKANFTTGLTQMEQCLYFKILKPGNFYESELSLKQYDVNTFELLPPSYIIKCENGQWVKFNSDAIKYYFFTIEELRENKLIELGI